jgi:hypothetical protein
MLQATFCLGAKATPEEGVAAQSCQLRIKLTPRQAVELAEQLLRMVVERSNEDARALTIGVGQMGVRDPLSRAGMPPTSE